MLPIPKNPAPHCDLFAPPDWWTGDVFFIVVESEMYYKWWQDRGLDWIRMKGIREMRQRQSCLNTLQSSLYDKFIFRFHVVSSTIRVTVFESIMSGKVTSVKSQRPRKWEQRMVSSKKNLTTMNHVNLPGGNFSRYCQYWEISSWNETELSEYSSVWSDLLTDVSLLSEIRVLLVEKSSSDQSPP